MARAGSIIEDHVKRSFKVGAGGTLNVMTGVGSIKVEANDTDSIDVDVRRKINTNNRRAVQVGLDEVNIVFEQDGSSLNIRTDLTTPTDGIDLEFAILAPRLFDMNLETSGGSVRVSNSQGNVRGSSGGGSLFFNKVGGRIFAETGGGDIFIEQAPADSTSRTVKQAAEAYSVAEPVCEVEAETGGGSVLARITAQPVGCYRLMTGGGDVAVHIADDIAAEIEATTSGGKIVVDVPVTLKGQTTRNSLKGSLKEGGPTLMLRTSGGSIYLRKL